MTNINRKIAIVGTGVIGASWATHFLAQGFTVFATDPADNAEARLYDFVDANWASVEALGLIEGASKSNLKFTTDLTKAVNGAEFVQESGPERIEVKHKLIESIEAAAGVDTIIASSTSGLLISDIQSKAAHPERIVLGHPFNPPHLIPLVEVLGGKLTTPENVTKAINFYDSIGKKPIRINKEIKGHVANRLQVALWREAFSLVVRGVASVEDIDTAISNGPGLRWALLGPFLNLHASGGPGGITHTLQHLGPAQREWAQDLGEYPPTDDYIVPCANGVVTELEGYDFVKTLKERDELLIGLLAAKKGSSQIP
ncbi:MAG: 3-hydroxyacyl-CoA dehydrogenase [Firmicutes bacterium]|nr:3-hydroxyacyl-CoA dehydrogenase [Bacillota bacterium]